MNGLPWLTLLTVTPIVGGLLVVGLDDKQRHLARGLALTFSLAALAMSGWVWSGFELSRGDLQFVERSVWVPTLGIDYFVGVDGLGLGMVLLTALVVPMSLAVSGRITVRAPLYYALVLFLEGGLFGTFTALNFFHWFIYWELSLVPAFFLIRLWGGPDRGKAALQFFVYTLVGSVALLLAFLALYQATGTFDFLELEGWGRRGELPAALATRLGWGLGSTQSLTTLVFLSALLGFAVKVPLMPFHTWLPLAYAEAPTPVTMLLTGLMSKMGVYGLFRILVPVFPVELRAFGGLLLALAAVTVVFGAAAAFAQRDLKRLLAYSSINHLGYCLLAAFAVAVQNPVALDPPTERVAILNGAWLQMFNHGLTAATLFCFVGWIESRSGGRRGVDDFGGLRRVAPVFTGLMGLSVFSSLGLPGLNGFVGEFLVFKGAFALAPWAAVLAVPGLLITAIFLLRMMERMFHGPLNPAWAAFGDLTLVERLTVAPAVALMLVLGIYPQLLIGVFNPAAIRLASGLP